MVVIDAHIGGEVTHRYGAALKGFAAKLTEQTLTSFQGSDIIEYVEADGVRRLGPLNAMSEAHGHILLFYCGFVGGHYAMMSDSS